MSTTKTVAEMVREARKAQHLTQMELAEKIQMSQRWVSDIERGVTTMPRLDTLHRLGDALNIDVADLLVAGKWASSIESAYRIVQENAEIAEAILNSPANDALRNMVRRQQANIDRGPTAAIQAAENVESIFNDHSPLTESELAELQGAVFSGFDEVDPAKLRQILWILRSQ